MIVVKICSIGLLAVLVVLGQPAWANEGFYNGSGSTLYPVKNNALRVISEKLTITAIAKAPCYEVLFRGKPSVSKDFKFKKTDFATVGKRTRRCASRRTFSPSWRAEAIYVIQASEHVKDVQMGFPVHTWDVDLGEKGYENLAKAPGVVGFRTSVDEKNVRPLKLKWLKGATSEKGPATLGYVWNASFVKDRKYVLRTTYDFGGSTSNNFYEGEHYVKGEPPWFFVSGYPKLNDGVEIFGARLFYYLSPLQLWASPPPSSIAIRVGLASVVDLLFANPLHLAPQCIDQRSLHYRFNNVLPEHDLVIAFAEFAKWKDEARINLPVLGDTKQWRSFRKTFGQAKMTCGLVRSLNRMQIVGSTVKKLLKTVQCVPSC